jgi:ABC-type branched-subunit amino acid transport system substrate-binding protein
MVFFGFPCRGGGRLARGLAGLALVLAVLPAGAARFTPEEEAGRKIFREGESPSGSPIRAQLGRQETTLPGTSLPCAGCHGEDGLGRPEGGVVPPNITWRELTKAYGHRHENGRQHPPFNAETFGEALTFGTDPAGNKLDPSMPRYIMSHQDMAYLVAYLKKIETDFDPGISADTLRIGTLVPRSGRLAELGKVVAGLTESFAADINARGGIYGRKLQVVSADFADDPKAAVASAERLVREQDVFALVSPFTVGIEGEIARLAEDAAIPVVGPFTLLPDSTVAINRYTFYLLPRLREQSMALAKYAATELGVKKPRVAIVYPEIEGYGELVAALEEQFRELKWDKVQRAGYPPGQMNQGRPLKELQREGTEVILFLGADPELAELGLQVRDLGWSPYLLAPGSKVARSAVSLPPALGNRVFLAFPTLPGDITPKGGQAVATLDKKAGIGGRHGPAQMSTYASLLVLEEGLKRSGHSLSRAKFTESLEKLFAFETGVTPGISYGPNRRVGVLGAHIVGVNLENHSFQPTGKFVRLD